MDTIDPRREAPYTVTEPARARTVPAPIGALALGTLPAGVGRRVGARIEVDVDAVKLKLGTEAAAKVLRYLAAVRSYRHDPVGDYVETVRPLVRAKLVDPKGGKKVRLTHELGELRNVTGVSGVIDALLGAEVAHQELEDQLAPFEGAVRTEGNDTFVEFTVRRSRTWPLALGGCSGPDEIGRRVRLRANHAASRRGAPNRLLELEIDALERFPDPDSVL
jgi:hypothetical protein